MAISSITRFGHTVYEVVIEPEGPPIAILWSRLLGQQSPELDPPLIFEIADPLYAYTPFVTPFPVLCLYEYRKYPLPVDVGSGVFTPYDDAVLFQYPVRVPALLAVDTRPV